MKSERRSNISPGVAEAIVFKDTKDTWVEVFAEYEFAKEDRNLTGVMPIKLGHVAYRVNDVQRTVNFYNWSNYMAPGVLDDFTRETGIKIVYDTFDANETLETRLLAGKSGYDVVVPTAYFLQRQITANVFQKLDKAKLPNLANAWPVVTKRLAVYDPGNTYAANYMWGTTGIGYNVKEVQRILGPDAKIDS